MTTVINWHIMEDGVPEGPALVFLHGFLGSGEDWREVMTAFTATYRCLCPDLPYHGATQVSPEDGPLTFECIAESLMEMLESRNVFPATLAGYSFGGRMALYLALRYPDKFDHLVLESASPGLGEEAAARRRFVDGQLAGRLISSDQYPGGFEHFLDAWYDMPLFATLENQSERRKALLESRLKNRPRALAQSLTAMGTGAQPCLWEDLPDCAIPTLLIVGERDRKFRIIAEQMAEASPKMAIEAFNNCGHNVHYENPQAFTTVLRSFLGR